MEDDAEDDEDVDLDDHNLVMTAPRRKYHRSKYTVSARHPAVDISSTSKSNMDRNHDKTQEYVIGEEDSDSEDFVIVQAQRRERVLARIGWNIGCIEGILMNI